MGAIATGFNAAFRDYNTDGVSASGAKKPVKSDIRALGATIETALAGTPQIYATITALRAVDAAANISDGIHATVIGRAAAGDTPAFVVKWVAASSATHDNVTVFRPTTGAASTGNGRWLLQNASPAQTFTAADATPSVANGSYFITDGSTAITDFDDAVEDQIFTVRRGSADIVITHDAAKIECGGSNVTLSATRPTATFRHVAGVHYLIDNTGAPAATAATLAALKALPKGVADVVTVAGKTTANDGWGGQFWWDAASSASGDDALVVTPDAGGTGRWRRLIQNWTVTPEMFGAVKDGSAADTTAIQAAISSGYTVLFNEGTYVSAGLTVPANTKLRGVSQDAILKKSAATGAFLTITGDDVEIRDLQIDGTLTTDTFAGGYVAGHIGIYTLGTSGTNRNNITVENCVLKNFGQSAIELYYVNKPRVTRNRINRCGAFGILLMSPLHALVADNYVENIFPGDTAAGVSPYYNAYGIAISSGGSERQPQYCNISRNHVKDVLPWEGIDIHNGRDCQIHDNTVQNCSQGIAVECHVATVIGRRISIRGNTVTSWSGASTTKDSQTYYKAVGIVANGGALDDLGQNLAIVGNTLMNCGDSRTSGGNSGAIAVRNWRNIVVSDNSITDAFRVGIVFNHDVRSATFTTTHATETINSNAHGLANGDPVYFSNSGGALPAGYTAGTVYYVINTATNTFQVSATPGGSAVAISGDGTGTHTWNKAVGGCFYINCHGNVIDGVVLADGVCRGISGSIRAYGHGRLNFVNSLQSGTQFYYQDPSPQYLLFFDQSIDLDSVSANRPKLLAARSYYVRTDGSDSNNGLQNNAGGAFLTIQKAIDVASSFDLNGYDITIQIGAGTRTQALTLRTLVGEGKAILLGDETTPANVTISTTSASCITGSNIAARWALRGLKLQTTTSGSAIVASGSRVEIEFQSVAFGVTVDSHIVATNQASVSASGNYSITGAAAYHINASVGATIVDQFRTITITGTPAFGTAFCAAARCAVVNINGNTFSGSATGKRHDAITNAVIFTGGTTVDTYLPGGTNGTTATGGLYA